MTNRKANGTWKKGLSGNPGGRSKSLDEVRDLAREETAASITMLARIRDSAKAPAQARVAACSALLDRGWGKPSQSIAMTHKPQDIEDVLEQINGLTRGIPSAHSVQ